MPVLRIGLMAGGAGCLYVAWASWGAGYPVEVALLRGVLAFMATTFVAYLGELVVATAPPVQAGANEADGANDGEAGGAAAGPPEGAAPIPMRPRRDERQAA